MNTGEIHGEIRPADGWNACSGQADRQQNLEQGERLIMAQHVVLKPSLEEHFQAAMEHGRVAFFSSPCGFGKSTTARALVAGRKVCALSAWGPEFALPPVDGSWDTLLIDDFQFLAEDRHQEALCEMIRNNPNRWFILLSRGLVPGWLLPFQFAGIMTVFGVKDLALDQESTGRLLRQYGVQVSDLELSEIQKVSKGCPMPLILLIRHLLCDGAYNEAMADQVRRELFLYFEERVFRPLDLSVQDLLLSLAPFEQFGPELARIVSGNPRAGEILGRFQRETTALIQDYLDQYHFWPIFRRFLLWELEQTYEESKRKTLYSRGGLFYELKEDYGKALECYSKSGDYSKVSQLLVKNAELHPGMGHYESMAPYYKALPEREILSSPALMQAMSMICAMQLDLAGSEQWYQALKDFAQSRCQTDGAGREARSRLAWLDLALPQRDVEGMIDIFPKVFRLLTDRQINLPAFSVTSTLPSLMNGGKDFSPWSKKDDFLYATLRIPVEGVLGRDGVCLGDCAVAESKFEKGENVKDRVLSLMSNLERVRRSGTPDMEFAVVGLLARTQLDSCRAEDARQTLLTLRERFEAEGESRFMPNLDAMICRVNLYLGNDGEVSRWYREKAPKNPQQLHGLKRYQYLTQAMVELALGKEGQALLTLAPLQPYFEACRRYIDGIHLHILSAIAKERLDEGDWRKDLHAALDTAAEFGFVRILSQYGVSLLPLVEECGWEGDESFLKQVLAALRTQAVCYPDYLRPYRDMVAPLSPTEFQVLRLLCADKSNAEISALLGMKVATVKVHVSHILDKLGVKRRAEAKATAQKLHLLK